MRQEVITRVRNSFAALLLELGHEPSSAPVASTFELPFSSMTQNDWRRAVQLWREHAADLLAPLAERPCPACGCAQARWLFESYDSHQFHECLDCGCWFTPKVVDWSVFERLFAISPEARAHAASMMKEREDSVRAADMARIGAYLDELIPCLTRREGRPLAYLDAGCGVGHSLRAGRERGLVVQGVEVDDAAVTLARKAGLSVALPKEVDAMPRGPYQLLTFFETLEHIAEPLAALQRFVPFLAEDGLVAITVPNLNAPATRMMREACPWVHGGYNTPGHVNLFHVPALERLLDRAGLTLIDAEGQFSSQPFELLAYLSGKSRGAFDILDPTLKKGALPGFLPGLLNDVWPGMELLEQRALWSPILKILACRQGSGSSFADAVRARKERRQQALADEARRLMSFEVDYKAMSAGLQAEVNLRDEMLRKMDGEMRDLRATWESSLSYKFGRVMSKLRGRG